MRRVPSLLVLLLSTAAPLPAQEAPTSAVAGPVTLLPGDLLRVAIWQEPDLSGEFQVDDRGRVILPLLGEIAVTGVPFPDLRDDLLGRYQEELRNPSISLTPLRRIYVLGEVNRPNLYVVDPTVSLAGVIALAQGPTASGNIRKIRIIRNGVVLLEEVAAEATLASVDVRSGDQIFIGRRSWFERNSTFVVSALLSLPGIIATILALT